MKARQQALKHSWDSASNQLNAIYYDAIKKTKAKEKKMNIFKHIWGLFYYGLSWLLLMILALLLMAPFVQVSSPQSTKTQKNDKNNNNNYQNKHNSVVTKKLTVS
jgi:hypothetical protein